MGTGKTYSTQYLLDSNNNSGVAGQVLSTTSTGIDWADANTLPGAGLWLETGNDIYNSNSGNVGIGTAIPLKKLSINGGDVAVNNGNSFIVGAAITGNTQIGELGADSGQLQLLTESTRDIKFGSTTYGNIMFLEGTNGNVGIGTTSPLSKLHIDSTQDAVHFTRTGQETYRILHGTSGLYFTRPNSSALKFGITQNSDFDIYNDAASVMFRADSSSGNVGIGTTSPTLSLDVRGTQGSPASSGTTQIGSLSIRGSGSHFMSSGMLNVSPWTGWFQVQDANNLATTYPLALNPNGGNVGIGTTNPDSKLNINGNSGDPSATYTTTAANSTISIGDFSVSGLRMMFGVNPSTPSTWIQGQYTTNQVTSKLLLNPLGGNVGIGTISPGYTLEIAGSSTTSFAYQRTGVSANKWGFHSDNDATYWQNLTTGNLLFTLQNAGNVGIGTTSPNDGDLTINVPKLHVVGPSTSGVYNLAARFQGGNDADNTGSSILINHSNDRGLLIKAGRKDGDREVAYFDVISSGGNITNMLTMGKFVSDYNVGIGTILPNKKLEVSAATDTTISIASSDTSINVGQNIGILEFASNNETSLSQAYTPFSKIKTISESAVSGTGSVNGAITFETADANVISERMRITSGGNVGIGTTTPDAKLDIINSDLSTQLRLSNTTSDATIKYGVITGRHYTNSEENVTGMLITSTSSITGGSVSIGGGVSAANAVNNIKFYTAANNTTLTGTERMRINSAGAIQFNAYDSTNNTGTPTYLLGTDGSGNVVKTNTVPGSGAGPYLPLAGGTLVGGLIGTSVNMSLGIKANQGMFDNVSGLRLLNPGGGSNNSLGNANTTGAIKITLPQSWTSTMMRMTIKVYEYTTDESFTVVCGGYNYIPSSAWLNEFAYIESSSKTDRNFTVRLGHDGTKCCVYIGELTSVWQYPKVYVTEFEAGFNSTTASNWQTGWDISMETTAFGTITYSEANTQINNWARSGNDVYWSSGSGNVGIETTSPIATLQVGSITATAMSQVVGKARIVGTNYIPSSTQMGTLDIASTTRNSSVPYNQGFGPSLTFSQNISGFVDGYEVVLGAIKTISTQTGNTGQEGAMTFLVNGGTSTGLVERMRIDKSGNVGIGTDSPTSILDIYSTAPTLTIGGVAVNQFESGRIRFTEAADTNGFQGSYIHYDGSTNKLHLGMHDGADSTVGNDVNAITILRADGNVGIGTTSPQQKLQVASPSATSVVLGASYLSTNNNNFFEVGINANDGYINLRNSGVSTTVHIDSDGDSYFNGGDVGIGTTTSGTFLQLGTYNTSGKYINQATYPDVPSEHMMHITAPSTFSYYGGGISFGETAFTAANIVVRDAGASGALDLCFGTGTASGVTEKMRITNNGNVGIGTTGGASQKLHVAGNLRVTGAYYDSNNSAGTSGQVLSSTASGTDWVDVLTASGTAGVVPRWNSTGTDLIDSGLSFPSGYSFAYLTLGSSSQTILQFAAATQTGDVTIKNTTGDIILQADNTTATTAKFTTSDITLGENTFVSGSLRVEGSVQADLYIGNIFGPSDTNTGYRINHSSLGCFIDVRNDVDKITYRDYPNATGTINSKFEMNMSSGNFTATGNIIAFGTISDRKLKENIKPIDSALDKAMRLQGVTFNWKKSDSILEIGEDIGFIAQDVQKVLPELVRENKNGEFSLRHQGITPILLEAIKELKAEIEELKKQIK